MDDWTPQERAEWQTRFSVAPVGSQERALLEDMQWTGLYSPASGSTTPGSYVVAQEPPSPTASSPATVPALPPLAPKFTSSTDEELKKAEMDALWNQRRKLTEQEKQAIVAKAPIKAGIATLGTRRAVPQLQGGRMKTLRSKKGGKIVAIFFNIRDQVKLYHWQTKSFAEHKATDDLVVKLDASIDMFVETYMGRYGRPRLGQTYPVKNLTVSGIRAFIARSDEWLTHKLPRMVKKTDTDLLNIRDEILADLNQIKYLFTLA